MEASWIRASSRWSMLPAAWASKTGGGVRGALRLSMAAVAAATVAVAAIVIGVILVATAVGMATVVVEVATVVIGAIPVATGEEAGMIIGPAVVVETGVLLETAMTAHPLTVAEEGAGLGRAHLPCIGIGAAPHHIGARIMMSVVGMTPIVEEAVVVVMGDMVITVVDVIEAVREMTTVADVTGAVKGVVTALNFFMLSDRERRYMPWLAKN